jgi:hypothetical protein
MGRVCALALIGVLLGGCASRGEGDDAPALPDDAFRFELLSVADDSPVGIGGEAFRMVIPAGWVAEGGIVWRHDLATLATTAMRVSSPDGSQALEIFPLAPHSWQEGGIFGFPTGANYLGTIVQPPVEPLDYLVGLLLPSVRAGVAYNVIGRQPLDQVASLVAAELGSDVRAEQISIEYTGAAGTIREDFYVVLSYTPNPFVAGALLWGPVFLYAFTAPAAGFDEAASVLEPMVASITPNLAWFAQYEQVRGLAVQNGFLRIAAAGELSDIITSTSAEISEIHRRSYEAQQSTYDGIHASISESVRGVETYDNPFDGLPVQLPAEYSHAWVSAQGEYILVNDPGFDPNVGSTQTWERLTPSA